MRRDAALRRGGECGTKSVTKPTTQPVLVGRVHNFTRVRALGHQADPEGISRADRSAGRSARLDCFLHRIPEHVLEQTLATRSRLCPRRRCGGRWTHSTRAAPVEYRPRADFVDCAESSTIACRRRARARRAAAVRAPIGELLFGKPSTGTTSDFTRIDFTSAPLALRRTCDAERSPVTFDPSPASPRRPRHRLRRHAQALTSGPTDPRRERSGARRGVASTGFARASRVRASSAPRVASRTGPRCLAISSLRHWHFVFGFVSRAREGRIRTMSARFHARPRRAQYSIGGSCAYDNVLSLAPREGPAYHDGPRHRHGWWSGKLLLGCYAMRHRCRHAHPSQHAVVYAQDTGLTRGSR